MKVKFVNLSMPLENNLLSFLKGLQVDRKMQKSFTNSIMNIAVRTILYSTAAKTQHCQVKNLNKMQLFHFTITA